MDKSKILPSEIVSVSLIISSMILYFGMNKLGDKMMNAGIYSSEVELQNRNNHPLRIVVDDASALRNHSGKDPTNE